jgi:hypothetical protein
MSAAARRGVVRGVETVRAAKGSADAPGKSPPRTPGRNAPPPPPPPVVDADAAGASSLPPLG